jgi:phage terminase large subunit-like protein
VCTNPGFENTWQATWRQLAIDSSRLSFHTLAEPSPWLSPEEIEEAQRRNSRARFHRLFWGQWISSSGDALDVDDIQAAVVANPSENFFKVERDEVAIAGLDLGNKHDHSALVVLVGSYKTLQLRLAYARSWKPDASTGKVDFIGVESETLRVKQQFGIRTVAYDPFQAALLAQRLEAQRVRMHEMTFSGANLTKMASTLLEVFRSRRLQLFDHKPLIVDLGRLSIEEKSYGFRLSATRTKDGHADLATALAIALPVAIEALDQIKEGRKRVATFDNASAALKRNFLNFPRKLKNVNARKKKPNAR